MAIIKAAGYEVDLTVEPPCVQVVKQRKPLGYGYSYAAGAHEYRSTIKVGSANWKRAVKEARALDAITDEQVMAYIAILQRADELAGVE